MTDEEPTTAAEPYLDDEPDDIDRLLAEWEEDTEPNEAPTEIPAQDSASPPTPESDSGYPYSDEPEGPAFLHARLDNLYQWAEEQEHLRHADQDRTDLNRAVEVARNELADLPFRPTNAMLEGYLLREYYADERFQRDFDARREYGRAWTARLHRAINGLRREIEQNTVDSAATTDRNAVIAGVLAARTAPSPTDTPVTATDLDAMSDRDFQAYRQSLERPRGRA